MYFRVQHKRVINIYNNILCLNENLFWISNIKTIEVGI